MRRTAITRAAAQSFDRVAEDYDRLGELNRIGPWLECLLPASGGRALDLGCGTGRHAVLLAGRFEQVDAIDLSGSMIDLARARRPRPNITYWQADLHDVGGVGHYDFVLSVLTLHHVPDLHAALSHIKTLLAPSGRAVVVDMYPPESAVHSPQWFLRRMVHRVLPLRRRLHGLAVQKFGANLVRRGPRIAWEIYRLSTRREWLDHRVTDRFFSREELERSCAILFPGYRFDILGGPRGIGLVWDAPCGVAAGEPTAAGLPRQSMVDCVAADRHSQPRESVDLS
jgi:ubiquinone/menaquinone biosynthesis C-methylase UbiE